MIQSGKDTHFNILCSFNRYTIAVFHDDQPFAMCDSAIVQAKLQKGDRVTIPCLHEQGRSEARKPILEERRRVDLGQVRETREECRGRVSFGGVAGQRGEYGTRERVGERKRGRG